MDQEELEIEISRLVSMLGTQAEDLVGYATALERSILFKTLRDIIVEKIAEDDQIAVDTISWLWKELSER